MIRRRAFTYVELTIVATIIAILAAIAVPNFLEAQVRSLVSRSRAELATVKLGLEAYRQDYKAYPPNAQPGRADGWDLARLTTPMPYLTALPQDVMTVSTVPFAQPLPAEPYRYFNALQVDPRGLQFAKADPAYQGGGLGGFAAGIMWGYGPSGKSRPGPPRMTATGSEQGPYQSWTDISTTGSAVLVAYDPTNGTSSTGDLYLTFP